MKNLSKAGGLSALYLAAAYLAAMPFFLLVLKIQDLADPLQMVETLVANQSSMYAMEFIVYVLFGLFLVVLAVALNDRLKVGAEALMAVATPIAIIWAGLLIASGMIYNAGIAPVVTLYDTDQAQAVSLWSAIDAVSSGLSGNGEIIGGTWMLLVSMAAWKTRKLPKPLNVLGIAIAIVAILSSIPALKDLAFIFGLGQIVWFVWLGIIMLNNRLTRME
ncbi:MAG: hypothetical protein A3J97_02855 [Spirochaetes bacterium RIFOXYC1_FULL_54_7]|nr:MAG: hypothetical protein A3J97_02855 [Spirochaetes bacterium RIFOXYC1_FULL_54_7]